MQRVTITTGARLHFGPLACGAERGRRFGGIGRMVDRPRCTVTASRADRDEIVAPDAWSARLRRTMEAFRAGGAEAGRSTSAAVRIELVEALPEHAGFGSGTQTDLAIAQALALLSGAGDLDVVDLAQRTGRGKRSAIGLHGFARGGLLVDGGLRDDTAAVAPLVARIESPAEWRWLLVVPRTRRGRSGSSERDAFAALPPMSAETSDRLCRLVLLDILPSAAEGDFAGFCRALDAFGSRVGRYFAPVQGGEFADPVLAAWADRMRRAEGRCVVQSSWGPTLCVPCATPDEADGLAARFAGEADLADCDLHSAAPLDTGAALVVE
jgi:beta-RFAP synthase